jgi:hypothetical protein
VRGRRRTGGDRASAARLGARFRRRPAGTPLGDGFVVADGTTLIGDPIPAGIAGYTNDVPNLDDGWVATSVVDGGDPRQIVEDYLVQAEQAGLVRQPRTGCLRQRLLRCRGFARSADPTEPRSLSIETIRGQVEDTVSDHVVVRYSTADLYWDVGGSGEQGDDPEADLAPVDLPPLQAVGEPIGTGGTTDANVLIQPGSRLAGPTHRSLDVGNGGVVAILEVTGDPREVLDRYLDHIVSLEDGFEASEPESIDADDAVLTTANAGESGGDSFVLALVERPGRPAWLRIEGLHD